MNSILSKACEELSKENPNIAYVRGMLETLLEMNTPQTQVEQLKSKLVESVVKVPSIQMIEGVPPVMPLDKIKAIAAASVE